MKEADCQIIYAVVCIYRKFKGNAYLKGMANTKENRGHGYHESQESDYLGGARERMGRTSGERWLCSLS